MRLKSFILLVSIISFSSAGVGQSSYSEQMINENTKTGQMFKVTLTPGKRMIEIHVVGKEAAKFNFSEMEMGATFSVGDRQWNVKPKRQESFFTIKSPSDLPVDAKPKLKVQIRHQQAKEEFNFNLNPKH